MTAASVVMGARQMVFGSALVLWCATSASAQRVQYEVASVEQPATLTGQVVFAGDVPRPRRFLITKDVEVCGLGYRERQEVEVSESRGLRNVVVVIQDIERGKPWPDTLGHYEITQENCVFAPHVQVIRRGAELDILNPDPVLHNIHGFESIQENWRTLFNFGQAPEEEVITHAIRPRRGNHIRLECDAHDFMLGWLYSADTPYAVAVDADGRFTIDGIPPGTYSVTAWHPYLGMQQQQITLPPNGQERRDFEFTQN
jgi:hypothetical protein